MTPTLNPSGIRTRAGVAFSIVGSPDYMSPEVLRKEGYGEEVDWWSLGIIFFEMLLGLPPFSGNSPEEVFQNISNWRKIIPSMLLQYQSALSSECYSLLSGLLCAPEYRLGDHDNIAKLKSHPFFAKLDWEDLKKETPPFIPKLSGDDDTSYFNMHDIEGINAKIDLDLDSESNDNIDDSTTSSVN